MKVYRVIPYGFGEATKIPVIRNCNFVLHVDHLEVIDIPCNMKIIRGTDEKIPFAVPLTAEEIALLSA